MIFQISLAILLFFSENINCIFEKAIRGVENQDAAQLLLRSFQEEVNRGDVSSAKNHLAKTFQMKQKDKPDETMNGHQYVTSLSNRRPISVKWNELLVVPMDNTVKIGYQSIDRNNEYYTMMDSQRDSQGRHRFVGGEMRTYERGGPYNYEITEAPPTTRRPSARGAPPTSDNRQSSYHYDQEPSTSGGSGSEQGSSSSSSKRRNRHG